MRKRNNYKRVKKILDRLFALILLILLLVPSLIIALLIKLDSNGPIFSKHKVTGFRSKEITLYRFRTKMFLDAKNNKKSRSTKIGVKLKKLKLDRIPLLFNVLKGDLSFIGPKALNVEYVKFYNKRQIKRLNVLPGIIGLAQVNTSNALGILDKIDFDLQYVKKISIFLDLKILFLAFVNLFKKNSDLVKVLNDEENIEILQKNREIKDKVAI